MDKNIVNIDHEIYKNRQKMPFQYIDSVSINRGSKCVYGKFDPLSKNRYYNNSLMPLLCLESIAQLSSILMRSLNNNKKSGGYLTQIDKLKYIKEITANDIANSTIKVCFIKQELTTYIFEVSINNSKGLIVHGCIGTVSKKG